MRQRNRLGPQQGVVHGALGVLQLACLVGGARRAGNSALVGLPEAGAVTLVRKGRMWRFDQSATVTEELSPILWVCTLDASPEQFQAQFAPRWQRMHQGLAERGLVPDAAEITRFRFQGAMLL